MNKMFKTLICLSVICLISPIIWADEVEEEINAGLTAYKAGEFSKAVESLEYAVGQIRQLKAQKIEILFPEPLEGWQAKEVESMAAGSMLFGGVISANRRYAKGSASVDINIATDNPMITFVSGMMSNPAMMTMAGKTGRTVKKIKGVNAVVEWDQDSSRGSIQTVVANKVMVAIEARNCSESEMLGYAEAIDYDEVEAFVSQ
ncbi:MAG: hypothetical protein JW869_01400 [Candidatus Omnitrophica bacterium]|nr:hypothetical protein [Candidatus Omnitrophota bacterium]